jgi:hypothetical protein
MNGRKGPTQRAVGWLDKIVDDTLSLPTILSGPGWTIPLIRREDGHSTPIVGIERLGIRIASS